MRTCGRWNCGSSAHRVRGRSVRSGLTVLLLASFAAPLAAQAPPPLDKTELIRLLTNPPTALGLSRDASAVTDDSGIAVFRLPVVSRVGTHQFEIRTGAGATFPGQPSVLLSVRSARPGRLRTTPDYVAFRGSDSSAMIVA